MTATCLGIVSVIECCRIKCLGHSIRASGKPSVRWLDSLRRRNQRSSYTKGLPSEQERILSSDAMDAFRTLRAVKPKYIDVAIVYAGWLL